VRRGCRSIANGAGESRFGETAPVERLAPILAAPGPGPRIAFFDQDAGHVLAVDQHPCERAAIAVRRLRMRIPPDIDIAGAEQLLQPVLGEDRQATLGLDFACPISAASMPSSRIRSSSERMVSPSITISAAPMAARVVIKG